MNVTYSHDHNGPVGPVVRTSPSELLVGLVAGKTASSGWMWTAQWHGQEGSSSMQCSGYMRMMALCLSLDLCCVGLPYHSWTLPLQPACRLDRALLLSACCMQTTHMRPCTAPPVHLIRRLPLLWLQPALQQKENNAAQESCRRTHSVLSFSRRAHTHARSNNNAGVLGLIWLEAIYLYISISMPHASMHAACTLAGVYTGRWFKCSSTSSRPSIVAFYSCVAYCTPKFSTAPYICMVLLCAMMILYYAAVRIPATYLLRTWSSCMYASVWMLPPLCAHAYVRQIMLCKIRCATRLWAEYLEDARVRAWMNQSIQSSRPPGPAGRQEEMRTETSSRARSQASYKTVKWRAMAA